jgi:hypothetical protein
MREVRSFVARSCTLGAVRAREIAKTGFRGNAAHTRAARPVRASMLLRDRAAATPRRRENRLTAPHAVQGFVHLLGRTGGSEAARPRGRAG